MQALVQKFLDQNKIHSLEGRRGVEGLAKLVNALNYRDDINRYGQMAGGACLGDIFIFLEDNSGAIEALVEWIQSRRPNGQWVEALESVVDTSELAAKHYPDGVCPDCGEEIDPEAIAGDECDNCGHVFNWGPTTEYMINPMRYSGQV